MLEKPDSISKVFRSAFKKSFVSLCRRLPLVLFFIPTPTELFIYEKRDDGETPLIVNYKFDFSLNVRENIHEIQKELRSFLPQMIEYRVEEQEYSIEELKEIVAREKLEPEEAVDRKKKVESQIKWLIEKISWKNDELVVRNLTDDQAFVCKSKIPVSLFLKLLKGKNNSFEFYKQKTIVLKELSNDYIKECASELARAAEEITNA